MLLYLSLMRRTKLHLNGNPFRLFPNCSTVCSVTIKKKVITNKKKQMTSFIYYFIFLLILAWLPCPVLAFRGHCVTQKITTTTAKLRTVIDEITYQEKLYCDHSFQLLLNSFNRKEL